jgi:mono/diheme cytochrome c family protein
MWQKLVVLSALVLLGISPAQRQAGGPPQHADKSAQATPPTLVIPPEAVKQPNPVKPTQESIAEGKHVYGIDCAMCHGANGSGNGDLAADMKLKLKDLRDPATARDLTDGAIFYIIQKGKGDMPAEGDRQAPAKIWDMVNYVRSLPPKAHSPKPRT